MLRPTGGDARVYGASILTGMPRIRQSLGVCPQFDILWPEISAREHLALYAAIKGYKGRDAQAVAVAAARDVGEHSITIDVLLFLTCSVHFYPRSLRPSLCVEGGRCSL